MDMRKWQKREDAWVAAEMKAMTPEQAEKWAEAWMKPDRWGDKPASLEEALRWFYRSEIEPESDWEDAENPG